MAAVVVGGKLEKDRPQRRGEICVGFKVGLCAPFVGGTPQVGFQLFESVFVHEFCLF